MSIVKRSILPKAIYNYNEILDNVPMEFSTETEKKNPKIYMESQKPLHRLRSLHDFILSDFKFNYKATVIKTLF